MRRKAISTTCGHRYCHHPHHHTCETKYSNGSYASDDFLGDDEHWKGSGQWGAYASAPTIAEFSTNYSSDAERYVNVDDESSPLNTPFRSDERGMATAEYAIATLAAVAFAGLLLAIMKSDQVRQFLVDIIQKALNIG